MWTVYGKYNVLPDGSIEEFFLKTYFQKRLFFVDITRVKQSFEYQKILKILQMVDVITVIKQKYWKKTLNFTLFFGIFFVIDIPHRSMG